MANEPIVPEILLEQIIDLKPEKLSQVRLREHLSEYQLCYLAYKGAYSIIAHKKAQRKMKDEIKDLKALKRIIERDPEAAEKFGYGVRA